MLFRCHPLPALFIVVITLPHHPFVFYLPACLCTRWLFARSYVTVVRWQLIVTFSYDALVITFGLRLFVLCIYVPRLVCLTPRLRTFVTFHCCWLVGLLPPLPTTTPQFAVPQFFPRSFLFVASYAVGVAARPTQLPLPRRVAPAFCDVTVLTPITLPALYTHTVGSRLRSFTTFTTFYPLPFTPPHGSTLCSFDSLPPPPPVVLPTHFGSPTTPRSHAVTLLVCYRFPTFSWIGCLLLPYLTFGLVG